MPKMSDVVKSESKTLSAKDLVKPVRLKIARWDKMTFDNDGKERERIVLFFEGAEKGMVLNATRNMQVSANLQTEDMDEWIGREIILEKGRTKFGDDVVDCVAVRDETPKEDPADFDDDIPF